LFKVRTTTKFEKIFDAYCQKNAIGANVTRFLFDGLRVKKEDTPAKLDMEDGDVIDAVMEQEGGC